MPLSHQRGSFGQKPRIVQTKYGETLLSKPLEWFGLGRDNQAYYFVIDQRIRTDPIPVGLQMAVDKTAVAYNARVPNAYRTESDRSGSKSNAPVFKMARSEFYIAKKMLLKDYTKQVWAERRRQLKDKKYDERMDKAIEAAEAIASMASMLIGPWEAIGEILIVKVVMKSIELTACLYALNQGDIPKAVKIATEGMLDVIFDEMTTCYPIWATFATKAQPYASTGYDVAKEQYDAVQKKYDVYNVTSKEPELSSIQVAADITLQQIYRFQCIIDPTLARQAQVLKESVGRLSVPSFLEVAR
jgi:hypothetical protein